MRSEKEIKEDAYFQAEGEVCKTDCNRYRCGTCIGKPMRKTNCYLFKYSYDYWVETLTEHECTADHHIMTCEECNEYSICTKLHH